MATYDNAPTSNETSRRYTAALMAIQYGMFDAVIDWGLTYTVMYAIIGGLTWYNVDTSFLMVIWGFSLMCSALILAVAGLKIPEWLGFYRKSELKTIRDTSGYAEKAVEDLSADGGTIAAFRYQVRLGIGKHFSQFAWFLLPFYTNLKFWFYLLSILVGCVIGQLFIFIVFKCRQRFRQRRGLVALGASAVVALGSAVAFVRGIYIVNKGWVRTCYVSLHLRAYVTLVLTFPILLFLHITESSCWRAPRRASHLFLRLVGGNYVVPWREILRATQVRGGQR